MRSKLWGTGHEGVWSKRPLLLLLNIHPAWYQTVWFRTSLFTGVLALLLGALYFILKRKQRRQIQQLLLQQQVQQEKERLSRDLHDNLGSQLTLLINNVHMLTPQQTSNSKINELKQNAKSMLQSLRQTIWVMSHESITLLVFTDKIIEYAIKYVKGFPAIELNIKRTTNEKEHQQISSDRVMQLFPIMQEALTNACRHADATVITFGFDYKPQHFEMYIADNGKGFDTGNSGSTESYGLKNMRTRSTAIHCDLLVESKHGKGSKITIQMLY